MATEENKKSDSDHKILTNIDSSSNSSAIDLRRHPRVEVAFPGEVISESGDLVKSLITNISSSGLRFEGERHLAETLFPKFNRREKWRPISLQISFSLPTRETVKINGSAVYVRRVKNNRCQIGMEFSEFEAGDSALANYLFLP